MMLAFSISKKIFTVAHTIYRTDYKEWNHGLIGDIAYSACDLFLNLMIRRLLPVKWSHFS